MSDLQPTNETWPTLADAVAEAEAMIADPDRDAYHERHVMIALVDHLRRGATLDHP